MADKKASEDSADNESNHIATAEDSRVSKSQRKRQVFKERNR